MRHRVGQSDCRQYCVNIQYMGTIEKVLVIGLDGATFDLLDPLIASGRLPHIAALKERGAWGRLASTLPPFTAAAWSSLITGQNPGQHGIITFSARDRYNYDLNGTGFVNAMRFDHTLWELLSEGGKRVGVVNVPLTYPARPVNGYMVSGMLTPPSASEYTYPPELKSRLGEEYVIDVDFIRDGEQFRLQGLPPKAEMLTQIQRMTRIRARTCLRLLQEEPWDFFMVVFTGTDRISHFFWDDLINLTAETLTPIQRHLVDYFSELDEAVGQLIAEGGSETMVFIVSDHGFGSAPIRRFYINVWLEKMGLLQVRGAQGLFDLEYWRTQVGRRKRLKALLRQVIPQTTQDNVKKATEARSDDIVDWSQTQAYFVPIYFHVCGIEINLAGRHREGIVAEGDDYTALRSRIIQWVQQLRDPETDRPVVEIVARREDLFHGRYVDTFPDIILVLNPDYVGAGSLAGGALFEDHPDPMRPGEHREDGIFIAIGNQVGLCGEVQGLHLIDVPATILYAMDIPVPTTFDGRVLTEIFPPDYVQSHTIQRQELTRTQVRQDKSDFFSQQEEDELEKRLRGLGYLE